MLEKTEADGIVSHDIAINLVKVKDLEQIPFRQKDALLTIALVAGGVGNQDTDTGAMVGGVEIENVHGPNGLAGCVLHNHQAELSVEVNVLRTFDEFFQHML